MHRRVFPAFWAFVFMLTGTTVWAGDMITREYRLNHADVTNVSRVLNMVVKNPPGNRIIGGQGKRLVITDTVDDQDTIAEILPVLDQPSQETVPFKIQMEMISHVSRYFYDRKKANLAAQKSPLPSAAPVNSPSGSVASFDKMSSTQPYKSVYSSEDAALTKQPRVILDEPTLPSLSALSLKGIFQVSSGSRLALMAYEGVNYTARDGGLFERNTSRVKGVTSQILKDRVILVGPDRIPREIKFISTL
jgi:hypothetical protein